MHIICTAIVEDEQQRSNLCKCVEILDLKPDVSFETVCVEYTGDRNTAEKLSGLFAQYPYHGICTLP